MLRQAVVARDPELAGHLFHVAVIMALEAMEGNDPQARGAAGGICGLWASQQVQMKIRTWPMINAQLAVAIYREGHESDPAPYASGNATSLSNLGTFLDRLKTDNPDLKTELANLIVKAKNECGHVP